jgi:hypothetical protein
MGDEKPVESERTHNPCQRGTVTPTRFRGLASGEASKYPHEKCAC